MQGADTCVQLGEGLGLGEVAFTASDGDGGGEVMGWVSGKLALQFGNARCRHMCTVRGRAGAGRGGIHC
jgi:hypothetical protein